MLSDLENKVILALQRDLDIIPQPFEELAEHLGVAQDELLAAIRSLMAKGYIRRFGATLRHQQSGYAANALVAWAVPEAELKTIGRKLAQQRAVTHCYARTTAPSWPYNLYTMIHGRTQKDCVNIATRMAAETGLTDYEMLFSETELKKTTMRYFREEEDYLGGGAGT
jgi:DNA-binding Lrp family transcriptional regulator